MSDSGRLWSGPLLNVEDYGARTANSDNSAQIQAAINALPAAGGTVLFPNLYPTTAQVNMSAGVLLKGIGRLRSGISYTGSGKALLFGSNDINNVMLGLALEDLAIAGTPSAVCGVWVRGATRWDMNRVNVTGFTGGSAGATGASGVFMNGGCWIGSIRASRIWANTNGINAQKQAGDGASGNGQTFNAITIANATEIQSNGYGILVGNPTTTETAPIPGQGSVIHGCTVEGNTVGGIWNVAGNVFNVRDNYFEGNGTFGVRVGSASGNASLPVLCSVVGNFFNLGTETGVDLLAGIDARVKDNYLVGATATGFNVAASMTNAYIAHNWTNSLSVDITDAGSGTVYIPRNAVLGWTNLTMLNSWTTSPTAGYIRDSTNGRVTLRGTVTAPGAGVNSLIATLPAGYRPAQLQQISATYWNGSAMTPGQLQIAANGNISAFSSADGTPPASAIYWLDSVTFETF